MDQGTLGYPAKSLADIPPGEYQVQAVLNVYETFRRSDGHTVLLPPDRGEGQHWESKPGNLMSRPQKLRVDASRSEALRLALTEVIPPIAPPVGDEVPEARDHQEPPALGLLGPRHGAWGLGAPASGLRRAQGGTLPARDLPRALQRRLARRRRLPRRAARPRPPGPRAGRCRVVPQALPGLDRGPPAQDADHDRPAREPVLRRLLRRELGQPRPLRRRHRARARFPRWSGASGGSARPGRA